MYEAMFEITTLFVNCTNKFLECKNKQKNNKNKITAVCRMYNIQYTNSKIERL